MPTTKLPSSYLSLRSGQSETARSPKTVNRRENKTPTSDPLQSNAAFTKHGLHKVARTGPLQISHLLNSPSPSSHSTHHNPIASLPSISVIDLSPRKRLLKRFREDSADPDCLSSPAFFPTASSPRVDISTSSTETKSPTTSHLSDCPSERSPADVSRSQDFDDLFFPDSQPRLEQFCPATFDLESFDYTVNDSDYASTDEEYESEDESQASPIIPVTPSLTDIFVPVIPPKTTSLSPSLEAIVWMAHDAARAELDRNSRETMWGLARHKRVSVKEEMAVRLAWKDDENTGDRGVPYY